MAKFTLKHKLKFKGGRIWVSRDDLSFRICHRFPDPDGPGCWEERGAIRDKAFLKLRDALIYRHTCALAHPTDLFTVQEFPNVAG